MDLESVADELYGMVPAEFIAARDARAAEARRDGERDLSAAIKKLGRPTSGAWLANLLVRERPQQIDQLLELGTAMREAQAELAAEQMRQLAGQRHQVVTGLGREAWQLAADRGQSISRAVREEMEGTLEAALADPAAGEALRSGRLTTSLRYSGLGPVDLDGAVGLTPRSATASPRVKTAEATAAAEQRWREARTQALDAQRLVDEKERTVREVRERVDGLRRQLDELEQQMQRLRNEAKYAEKSLRDTERSRELAAITHQRATARVAAAAAEVREMGAADRSTRDG